MSDMEKGGFIAKVIGPKRRWRAYKARVRALPPNYRTTVEAIERYLMHFVPTDGESVASEFEDLADLFERAAADGTPIREIVGDDPAVCRDKILGPIPTDPRQRERWEQAAQPGSRTASTRA